MYFTFNLSFFNRWANAVDAINVAATSRYVFFILINFAGENSKKEALVIKY